MAMLRQFPALVILILIVSAMMMIPALHAARSESWLIGRTFLYHGLFFAILGSILGIALGTSTAAGYVTRDGNITSWLNELAFVPIDYHPDAPADEWSGDYGVGA